MDGYYSDVGEAEKKQKDKAKKINSYFRYEARRLLFSGDNLYKSVIAWLISGMTGAAFYYITYVCFSILRENMIDTISKSASKALAYSLGGIMFTVGSFFFFATICGVYDFIYRMCTGINDAEMQPDIARLGSILSPIGSKRELSRTIKLFLFVYPTLIFVCGFSALSYYAVENLITNGALRFLCCAVVICGCIFMLLFFIFLLLPYPSVKDELNDAGVARCVFVSARCALCDIWRAYSLLFSFLWLILLSVLSFGVLFIIYTLPYMTAAFAGVGKYTYNIDVIEREKIKANTERN